MIASTVLLTVYSFLAGRRGGLGFGGCMLSASVGALLGILIIVLKSGLHGGPDEHRVQPHPGPREGHLGRRPRGRRVLGLAEPSSYGPFAVLQFDNGTTLDFIEDTGEIKAQHYAFLVGEDDFDAIWDRLKEQGRQWWADPHKRKPGEINHARRRPRPLLAGPGRPLAGDHHPPVRQRGLNILVIGRADPTPAARSRPRFGAG